MLPNSAEWKAVRNQIYADLRQNKQEMLQEQLKETGQTVNEKSTTVDFSSFYNLLVVRHKEVDSYETLNILNYFGFPINVEEEDFWGGSRKDFDFSKHDSYPFLVINSAHDEMPSCELAGKENILAFLYNKNLISSYRSYGVYE